VGALLEGVVALASEPNFATVTTLLADGSPVGTLMWIDTDGDFLLVNTERHRLKYRNVCRDPRVHILVVDRDDEGRYAAVRGVVEDHIFGSAARAHIDRLALRYLGTPFDPSRIVSERVLLRVRPVSQRVRESAVVVE
jgi:PPOX class probable F420-dependent enzyme